MKLDSEVLVRIRELILQGAFAPGQRIAEAQVAELLGVSRTPVRQALPVLAKEGLLVPAGARGFAVRAFTISEIAQGVDLRGALEGFAARVLAERGADPQTLARLREILEDGDAIFARGHLVEADEQLYAQMNGRFHAGIVDAANVSIVGELLERVNRIPFTSPGTIAFDRLNLKQMFDDLQYAQRQHHEIVNAIAYGEGARVEALLREHVNTQKHSMNLRRAESQAVASTGAEAHVRSRRKSAARAHAAPAAGRDR
ncbi:MAG: GntR family transcriptional regulator [Beijerinckiaceae bacterium]|nr:GntR family transcriptional regulator [Beijerinckiaceae bacterium]